MTAQPDPVGVERMSDDEWTCADCGSPIEANAEMDKAFSMCRPCYDAYVDNAGR
jgi:NMD protein affecting ribosome stability and mRNA decay